MPTLSQIRLPVPKSWDEFEAIVASAISTQNPSVAPSRYGRSGQAQTGVDIYFEDAMTRTVGVQCKCVENFTFTQLTDEVTKAEAFVPRLESFVIALALPRDAKLQKQVFKLSHERAQAQKFRVGIWFWDDIADDLSRDPAELARHYPQLFGNIATPPTRPERVVDDIAKQRFSAYQELWSYLHSRLLPNRRHPDYDWDNALDEMALDLHNHSKQLDALHKRLGAILPKEVESSIASAAAAAQDGASRLIWLTMRAFPTPRAILPRRSMIRCATHLNNFARTSRPSVFDSMRNRPAALLVD